MVHTDPHSALVKAFEHAESVVMLSPGQIDHFYTYILGSWLGVLSERADIALESRLIAFVNDAARKYGPK